MEAADIHMPAASTVITTEYEMSLGKVVEKIPGSRRKVVGGGG
jgi:hypothetical protein